MQASAERPIRTVLVVDDDPRILRAYVRAFQRTQPCVLPAADLATAKRLASSRSPDLAIIDLFLPDGSGLDLIVALRAADPTALLIMVSGYASTQATVAAIRAGASDVLAKPVKPEEIMRRVRAGGQQADDEDVGAYSLERAAWEHVHRVVADCCGNKSEAARQLGIDRNTLQRWLRRPLPRG